MKLYVIYYDGYDGNWGSEIYILGIYDSKEKAEQAIERNCGYYLYEIKEIELNKDVNEYLGGYIGIMSKKAINENVSMYKDFLEEENNRLKKKLRKARKKKKRWKKKYLELRDRKKSIELARIEDGLGLEPILYDEDSEPRK